MQDLSQPDERFDIYFDVYETLFGKIRELMDAQHDLATLKQMRDHVVLAVANIENVEPESVYQEMEDVRHT